MASFRDRVPQNVPGKFYVDSSCIYCELCVLTDPRTFRESNEMGWAFVFSQPKTNEELRIAMSGLECCPTHSIGFDGDIHDWTHPEYPAGMNGGIKRNA
jgi:ferredoxin